VDAAQRDCGSSFHLSSSPSLITFSVVGMIRTIALVIGMKGELTVVRVAIVVAIFRSICGLLVVDNWPAIPNTNTADAGMATIPTVRFLISSDAMN
jgi:hypothetical protein